MRGGLTVVGDVLVDRDLTGEVHRVCPDAPVPVLEVGSCSNRPGGAGLAAVLAVSDGRPVTLVSAVGGDRAGEELVAMLAEAGVRLVDLELQGPTPEKVRARAGGQALLRMDYGGPTAAVGPLSGAAHDAISGAACVLVSDYGRGMAHHPGVRSALAARRPGRPVVWDPHPRGADPVPGVRLVTPNRSEAGLAPGASLATVAERARHLARQWRAAGVAVTLGAQGALLAEGDAPPFLAPVPAPVGGDPCGAGDRFASRAAGLLADGALPSEAVVGAVEAASAFVAAGAAGPPAARPDAGGDAYALATRVRAGGGTVVATGGCFDLVHAGHVGLLQGARRLGDCLIVCLNSDGSVRRIKGEGRPLQTQDDRAAVLRALGCVDAIAVFDEDTPEAVLERLRPHLWVKGADYRIGGLPEAASVARWGGQAVVLPYLEGRSTTRLLEEATRRDRS